MKISVLVRLLTFAAIVAAIYWYWSGPWQEKVNPSYESILRENQEKMDSCIRGAAYKRGATGVGAGAEAAREQCAEQFNLYELDGRWHSHDMVRPD